MATRNYEGKKFEMEAANKIVDALTVEEALQININDQPFTVSMRTPGEDASLVRGLLHSEGIINDLIFNPDIVLKK
jgi:FdhD protein